DRSLLALRPSRLCAQARSEYGMPFHTQACKEYTRWVFCKLCGISSLSDQEARCEDTNLSLNWEKSHFMVKEGIVLSHKISKKGIEVDKAKIDVIAKLPHPTTVKGIRSFLGHAGFYRRFIQDFSKISRPMTHLLEKNTPFIFSDDCIQQKFVELVVVDVYGLENECACTK
ncbi:hypothetical protein Tco_0219126, partial [Tanacetum coccineum]